MTSRSASCETSSSSIATVDITNEFRSLLKGNLLSSVHRELADYPEKIETPEDIAIFISKIIDTIEKQTKMTISDTSSAAQNILNTAEFRELFEESASNTENVLSIVSDIVSQEEHSFYNSVKAQAKNITLVTTSLPLPKIKAKCGCF